MESKKHSTQKAGKREKEQTQSNKKKNIPKGREEINEIEYIHVITKRTF